MARVTRIDPTTLDSAHLPVYNVGVKMNDI